MEQLTARERAKRFCRRFGLAVPVLEAPMAGANSVARAAAIANAGGMAGFGALVSKPEEIADWVSQFRAQSKGALQINLWIPEPKPPARDAAHEAKVRAFLAQWGPTVDEKAGGATPLDFEAQCRALLAARPSVASSIMGLYPPAFVRELKANGIAWLATATTLAEARAAEAAGADAIIAQGFEAGGHRGAFDNCAAERQAIGLVALLPRLADHIGIPVIATGGIADGRGIAAALTLGASAVAIGTAFLAVAESEIPEAWRNALRTTEPQDTWPTRGFSGRLGRAIANDYVRALAAAGEPMTAPYPVQRGLTGKMRVEAIQKNDIRRMQAWAGQSAWMATQEPAGAYVKRVWNDAERHLP